MNICTRALSLVIIHLAICLNNTGVSANEVKKKCAPGCFCVFDGQIPERIGTTNICGYTSAQRFSCDSGDTDFVFAVGTNAEGILACNRKPSTGVTYFFDEFSELYKGSTGMYGFIGEDLIVMPTADKTLWTLGAVGAYQCPSTHPSSAEGAKTPYECYTHDATGKKVYFTPIAGDGIRELTTKLQNITNKAITITKELQSMTANETNKVNTVSNTKKNKSVFVGDSIKKPTAGNKIPKSKLLQNKSAIIH